MTNHRSTPLPSAGQAPAHKLTAKEKAEKAVADLHARVAECASEDDWRAYLDFASRFHNYSPTNTLLLHFEWLFRQARGEVDPGTPLTQVAGYEAWKAKGERFEIPAGSKLTGWDGKGRNRHQVTRQFIQTGWQVKRGEKGLPILAPRIIKEKDETGRERKRLIGWLVVYVYDVSQTAPVAPTIWNPFTGQPILLAPVPEVVTVADGLGCRLLEGEDDLGLWDIVVPLIEAQGYTVSRVASLGGANGRTTYGGINTVEVVESLEPIQQAKTLLHELGHVLLHEGSSLTREVKEVEAESVAYVVLHSLGIDSGDYTLGYVRGWSNGDEVLVANTAKRVTKCAQSILEGVETGTIPAAKAPKAKEADEALAVAA